MPPLTDPDRISDPRLRQLGRRALSIAKLETTVAYLADLARQRSAEDVRVPTGAETVRIAPLVAGDDAGADSVVDPTMTEIETLAFAKSTLSERLAAERARLAGDLRDDQSDRWELLWTEVIAPWRTPSEGWRAGTPPWIRVIGTEAVIDRCRRVVLDGEPSAEIQATGRPLAPTDLAHPALRAFAQRAAWVATLRAASDDERGAQSAWFYYPDDENFGMPEDDIGYPDADLPWEDDPVEPEPVTGRHDAASQRLERALAAWLSADPEHRSIFNLLVVRPWERSPGRLRPDRPDWVAVLTKGVRAAARPEGDRQPT